VKFWDSSAIVMLLTPQGGTAAAEQWFQSDPDIVVWWASPVECASALGRLAREGRMNELQMEEALARLDSLMAGAVEVDPVASIRAAARRLVRVHPLRASDALQLAAASEIRGPSLGRIDFVCFDARLATAARREGFAVP
jgi:uncharacterized protein